MEADDSGDVEWGATAQLARAELERLLADPDFQSTERNKNFLRFVAEQVFEGRENTIKAYSIAVDVFGRPCSFDPATDPIVRIEATRLRASLARYYELHGDRSTLRIDLPKGRYVPIFMRVPPQAGVLQQSPAAPVARLAGDGIAARRGPSRLWPSVPARWMALALGGAAGLCLGVVLLAVGLLTELPVISERPSVDIDMRLAGGASDTEALALRDSLMVALSQFQTVRVLTDPMATQAIGKVRAAPAMTVRTPAYRVSLKHDPADRSIWWQVVDMATGEAVRSGVERIAPGTEAASVSPALVNALATRLGGSRGVINDAETARELDDPSLGNGCVLRTAMALDKPGTDGMEEVRSCLEATLSLRPNDADAHAALANVLLRMDKPEAPTELTHRALDLASKSVMLAPRSDRSRSALMTAQFRNGQTEAAIVAGRRALELNPLNAAVTAKFGALLFRTGEWDEGLVLVHKALAMEVDPYREAEVTLALDAYRRGAYEDALLRVRQLGDTDCYCVNVLRVAALGQLGRSEEAAQAAEALRQRRVGIEKSYRSDMAARHFNVALTDQLQAGLAKAGMIIR